MAALKSRKRLDVEGVPQKASNDSDETGSSESSISAGKRGVCFASQDHFVVPKTQSVSSKMLNPKYFSFVSAIIWVQILAQGWFILFGGFPIWLSIAIFAFWRLAYNAGLGVLLRRQSGRSWMTKLFEKSTRNPNSLSSRIAWRLAATNLARGHDLSQYPVSFNAWLCYRSLVDVVLTNDGITLFFLFVRCFRLPSQLGPAEIFQYAVGLGMAVFNYWAKVDAHRCIGDYAWYWGDFFFRIEQKLTFDGIFELFPHPMYTVGYTAYYGFALIARSYTVFFVCSAAHTAQLIFLVLVEEPHMEKLYGSATDNEAADKDKSILYDPSTGYYPSQSRDSIGIFRLSLHRSSDVSLVLLAAYGLMSCLLIPDRWWCVFQVCFWRLAHWIFCGVVLYKQSHGGWWNNHFLECGRTLQEAFTNWKRLYNTGNTMNFVVFFGCFLRYYTVSEFTPLWAACQFLGLVMMLITVYTVWSTYCAVGDFGYFYGDFFIPPSEYKPNLVYTGIYRFLNNPDCVTGYFGLYGMALMAQSWTVFFLAALHHALNIIFVNLVEVPHLKSVHRGKVRLDSPHVTALKKSAVVVDPNQKVEAEVKKIKIKARAELLKVYSSFSIQARKLSLSLDSSDLDSIQIAYLSSADTHALHEPITVEFRSAAEHSALDWIGLYKADVPSAPGLSKGKWHRTGPGGSGKLTFAGAKLPVSPGHYELRYHLDGSYTVVGTKQITIQ